MYQLSSPAPATRSCSSDLHPAAVTVRGTLLRFTIRHNKVWPFEETPLFCHSCLVRCQSLIFQKFAGTSIFIDLRNTVQLRYRGNRTIKPKYFLKPMCVTVAYSYADAWRRNNKDERNSSLEKYTSHFIERVVCERELETEQNCNILTPTLLAITAFLFRSPGQLNREPEGPASLGHVPKSSIFSQTHLISNWLTSCLHLGYIIVQRSPSSCERHKSHSFNPSMVKVIFWYSSTRCTCYLHRCISYFDCPAGSEVNIQHNHLFSKSTIILILIKWFCSQI